MSKRKPASFTPYFTQKDADQVRAAFLAAGPREGYASVTEFIEAAVLREVKRLQRKHNNGRTWEPAPPGALRTGRRSRTEERRRELVTDPETRRDA